MLHLGKGYVKPTQCVKDIGQHTTKIHLFDDEILKESNKIQYQMNCTKTEVNLLYREMKSVAQLHHVEAIKKR